MKLYHATMNLDIIKEFTPRIPENRFAGEEEHTKRICLSSSIEGCITAAPFGGSSLSENIYAGSNSSKLIRIYEFDISEIERKHIYTPDYLYKKDLVRDAAITGEYWITVPIKPVNSYIIKLTKFDDNYGQDDIAYEYVKLFEDGKIEDITPYIDGWITEIVGIEYDIVPEERRSKIIKLDHEVNTIYKKHKDRMIKDLYDMFIYSSMTYIDLEYRDDITYLTGQIDTRGREIDILDISEILEDLSEVYYNYEEKPLFI
ncbi:MAG: hypothetical protein M0Q88_02880 [Bacilli bacterium]|nr:hypothetical protein [Bacilli bacterium]